MFNLEKLDLAKKEVFDIIKRADIGDQKAKVIVCLDYSASMRNLYARGVMQKVVERLIPIAMAFDDDQSMEVYAFHNSCKKLKDLTIGNLATYIQSEVSSKMSFGGTDYSPALGQIFNEFMQNSSNVTNNGSSGFFGFMKKPATQSKAKVPAYVIFITDGDNDYEDKVKTQKLMVEMSNHGIFIQYVGVSDMRDGFGFLRTLDTMPGRTIDNANFFQITSSDLAGESDSVLYNRLLAEFPDWVKEAKSKNIIY